MKKTLLSLLFLTYLTANAQEEKKVTVKPYGFIGFDAMYDTRLSVTSRFDHVYLYPNRPEYDTNGKDINAKGKYDFGAAITRAGLKIGGPNAFGANTSGVIEFDFAGSSSTNDYVVRLRHAYIKMDWKKNQVIVGKTWHPFFVTENFPSTVNFVVGAPIHPLMRAPQIRLTHNFSAATSLGLTLLSESDFKVKGPADQVELSNIPETILQFKYKGKQLFISAAGGIKQQLPLAPDESVTTNELVTSGAANLSLKYKTSAITAKAEAIYGGSMTNLVMLGGLAQKTDADGNALEGEYAPINISSYWGEVHTNGKKYQVGLWGGITYNLGTKDASTPASGYNRGGDIGYVYSIAPRIRWYSGKMQVGLEWMYTVAAYNDGTSAGYDKYSKPIGLSEVSNNRITLGVRYLF